jgi:hypothetical protein
MKKQLAQKILSYSVMGISMILIGILLIPLGILFVLVWAIWTAADKLLCIIDRHEKGW